MEFKNLPQYAKEEILKAKEITGFTCFMARKTNRGIIETDVKSWKVDQIDNDLGWEEVINVS